MSWLAGYLSSFFYGRERSFGHFETLPEELKVHVLSFLPIKDLLQFSRCSTASLESASKQYLWIQIGSQFNLPAANERKTKESVAAALKLALEVERLNFFPKKKFQNPCMRIASIMEQSKTPAFQEKLDAGANKLTKNVCSSNHTQELIARMALLKQMGACFSCMDKFDPNLAKGIMQSPFFPQLVEILNPILPDYSVKFFHHAFRNADLKTCCLLLKDINKQTYIVLNEICPLTVEHLKIAKHMRMVGFPFRIYCTEQVNGEIFNSAAYAAEWFAVAGETHYELKFPQKYLTRPEDFEVAHLIVQAGYKVPVKYIISKIISQASEEEFDTLLPLYSQRETVKIRVPSRDFCRLEQFFQSMWPLFLNPDWRFTLDFSYHVGYATDLSAIKEIAKNFLAAGHPISSQTFKCAIKKDDYPLLSALVSLYESVLLLNIQFPSKYFDQPIHFIIAELFVQKGFKLPLSYLGKAIYRRDCAQIKRLVPLYQNQAPLVLPPILSRFPAEKLEELKVLLSPLL